MERSTKELCQSYVMTHRQSAAWHLLASRRAPLVLSCLKPLFDQGNDDVLVEDALAMLSEMMADHANNSEFNIISDNYPAIARKELRDWIKRGLIVERKGRLSATDALQRAFSFVDGLNNRIMTSTASRLATVQREIENLEANINPDAKSRADYIERQIKDLEYQLQEVRDGNFRVLEGKAAEEGVREVYTLAMSLMADFRRVEDSYREADRKLRKSIINDNNDRGEIMDQLLDGHDDLLDTPEGQVFHSFNEQLKRPVELDNMKNRLRNIFNLDAARRALNKHQINDLRSLNTRLVRDSINVIRARSRSERDVKGFIKTGLAAEHHRVGALLTKLFSHALNINWETPSVRKSHATLPPVGIAVTNLPLIERLRYKARYDDEDAELVFTNKTTNVNDINPDILEAFDTLDRTALGDNAYQLLLQSGSPLSVANMSSIITRKHDLETLALLVTIARKSGSSANGEVENFTLADNDNNHTLYTVPKLMLSAETLKNTDWEIL